MQIQQRKIAYRSYINNKTEQNLLAFNTSKRIVKRTVKAAKRKYESDIANNCKLNPKKFYEYVNKRKSVKNSIGPITDSDGMIVNDDVNISNILNKYFASVFAHENNDDLPEAPNYRNFNEPQKLSNIIITEENVKEYIDKLKPNKSHGPDNIHAIVIKELKDIIAKPLTVMFNSIVNSGIIPQDFKNANVTPIFKKRDKKSP